MNDKTGAARGPRLAGALAVMAAVAVLATACGGLPAPTYATSGSGGPGTYPQMLALARCIRGHGMPSFPDPGASGYFDLNATTLDSGRLRVAYGACRHLLPGGGPNLAQLQREAQQRLQQSLPALLRFSHCMRSHGVPNFPDPGAAPKSAGTIDPGSPQFLAAVRACHPPAGLSLHLHTSVQGHRS